jgi:drug/metabolite transporter (DMT)-like permease
MRGNNRVQLRNTLLLMAASAIWGLAFVAQSVGSEHVGPYTFLAARSWLACLFLILLVGIRYGFQVGREKQSRSQKAEPESTEKITCWKEPRQLLIGGLLCGIFLFSASAAQQMGVGNTDSTAKAGFITALYVVLVPILQHIGGKRTGIHLWLWVAVSLCGLYLLCLAGKGGLTLTGGEWQLLLCALLFAFQIICVGIYGPRVDVIQLSFVQFFVTAILATVFMIWKEQPQAESLKEAGAAILYCGILSSGVGFTLQIVGQRDLDPTIASLAMCLESVFSAVGGFLILHQSLSAQELMGCVLMFAAIVGAQLPTLGNRGKRVKDSGRLCRDGLTK